MTVYFAQARVDRTTVKIGFTSDLVNRQKNLSVSAPGGVAILATLPGGKETEEYLHEKFASQRLGGEWFRFDDEIQGFIRDILNGKAGLVPFRDEAQYMVRTTAEYGADAVASSREMAVAIINAEYIGAGDTTAAVRARIQRRTGLSADVLRRLFYRDMKDIRAGEYLHLKAVYDEMVVRRGQGENVVTIEPSLRKHRVSSAGPDGRPVVGASAREEA